MSGKSKILFVQWFSMIWLSGRSKILIFHWFFKVFGIWELENIDFSLVFEGSLVFFGAPGGA